MISLIEITPLGVDFREPLGRGVRVIRVLTLETSTPRVMTFYEDINGMQPTSFFMSEIEEAVEKAIEIRNKESS
jgi:hypothetical protein